MPLVSWGREKPAQWTLKCLSVQIEDGYLGKEEKKKKEMSNKKADRFFLKLHFFDCRFTNKATVKWKELDPQKRRLICLREYSAITSLQPSYKALRILKEHLLKVSKHSSPVTDLICNKIVFTVSVPELMRLNGWLSLYVEMKQIIRWEHFQTFITLPI